MAAKAKSYFMDGLMVRLLGLPPHRQRAAVYRHRCPHRTPPPSPSSRAQSRFYRSAAVAAARAAHSDHLPLRFLCSLSLSLLQPSPPRGVARARELLLSAAFCCSVQSNSPPPAHPHQAATVLLLPPLFLSVTGCCCSARPATTTSPPGRLLPIEAPLPPPSPGVARASPIATAAAIDDFPLPGPIFLLKSR
ncbi:hypothetical protein NL676_007365 [Syzygium grande]|nr:hypothetical protein NL676_007365 [Syzygium grande]